MLFILALKTWQVLVLTKKTWQVVVLTKKTVDVLGILGLTCGWFSKKNR